MSIEQYSDRVILENVCTIGALETKRLTDYERCGFIDEVDKFRKQGTDLISQYGGGYFVNDFEYLYTSIMLGIKYGNLFSEEEFEKLCDSRKFTEYLLWVWLYGASLPIVHNYENHNNYYRLHSEFDLDNYKSVSDFAKSKYFESFIYPYFQTNNIKYTEPK